MAATADAMISSDSFRMETMTIVGSVKGNVLKSTSPNPQIAVLIGSDSASQVMKYSDLELQRTPKKWASLVFVVLL